MRRFTTGLLCLLLQSVTCLTVSSDVSYWNTIAKIELEEALKVKLNTDRAKNVILFVGDGMGPNTVTATRIYKNGEGGRLSFEKFPHVGLLKTYCNDKQVPDSASTATALFTGVKTNYETAGVSSGVKLNDCEASLKEDMRLKSLVNFAIDAEMSTGFVTTMRVTHATPSALYAHTASRKWECEDKMPPGTENCKDIGRQLIEDEPGRNINVIMGGGRQCLVTNSRNTTDDPFDMWSCSRKDGRDLIQTWMEDKQNQSLTFAVAQDSGELDKVKTDEVDYLLGIFANGHLKMEHERDTSDSGMPSITKMTEVAIKILQKNPKGYFLMVEGGNIDMAHHRGKAKRAINEAATLDEAVKIALAMTDPTETLVVVTSDHTHTLSINGYPKRGDNIFTIASASKVDGRNYTTLTYATGGEETFQYTVVNGSEGLSVERRDPSKDDVKDFEYISQAAILTDENTHGGGDVIVYALGPFGHLFHNIHEQNYVMHAICYAAGIGEHIEFRPNNAVSTKCINIVFPLLLYVLVKFVKLCIY